MALQLFLSPQSLSPFNHQNCTTYCSDDFYSKQCNGPHRVPQNGYSQHKDHKVLINSLLILYHIYHLVRNLINSEVSGPANNLSCQIYR